MFIWKYSQRLPNIFQSSLILYLLFFEILSISFEFIHLLVFGGWQENFSLSLMMWNDSIILFFPFKQHTTSSITKPIPTQILPKILLYLLKILPTELQLLIPITLRFKFIPIPIFIFIPTLHTTNTTTHPRLNISMCEDG